MGLKFHAIRPDPPELTDFLDSGDPPLVFTLGSSAVYAPGDFYGESVRAAIALRRRAVLLMGQNPPQVGDLGGCKTSTPHRQNLRTH